MADKELQAQEKRDLRTPAESTTGGPVFIPHADIYEDSEALYVVVDMPGVDKSAISINLENDTLSIYGKATRPEFESKLTYAEYRIGDFSRSFILTESIDQAKIDASVKNGVLNLKLPKAEQAKPKKIEIKTD